MTARNRAGSRVFLNETEGRDSHNGLSASMTSLDKSFSLHEAFSRCSSATVSSNDFVDCNYGSYVSSEWPAEWLF